MSENESGVNLLLKDTVKSPDFYEDYANNVYLESSVWDMKLIFGRLDQRANPPKVEQHGSVSMPWSQTKIFAYLLCAHIAGYELQNGQINVPSYVLPPLLPEPTEDMKKADPTAQALFERIMSLREQFFGESSKA